MAGGRLWTWVARYADLVGLKILPDPGTITRAIAEWGIFLWGVVGFLRERIHQNLKEWLVLMPSDGFSLVLVVFGVALLWNDWRRGREHDKVETQKVELTTTLSNANRNGSQRTFSTVAPVLYGLRETALSDLVDCEIRNDAQMERWEKDVTQWFAKLDQIIKELFSPEDLAYLKEQERTRKGLFFGYRYRFYNERHESTRHTLWLYTEILKDIIDRHD